MEVLSSDKEKVSFSPLVLEPSGTIGDLSDGESISGQDNDGLDAGKKVHKRSGMRKTARARTVLSEKQLNILKTCYSANPRPDALMKEQLVEMTGSLRFTSCCFFLGGGSKEIALQGSLQ